MSTEKLTTGVVAVSAAVGILAVAAASIVLFHAIEHRERVAAAATAAPSVPPERLAAATLARVIDGDTVVLSTAQNEHERVRLMGIEAPERKWYEGQVAKDFTETLLAGRFGGQRFVLARYGEDRYGRTVGAIILPGGTTVSDLLVRAGLAVVWEKYCTAKVRCDRLNAAEDEAMKDKIGIWAMAEDEVQQ